MRRPNVFTIPSGAPFLPTLVDALLDGRLVEGFDRGVGPLSLADATIYVPTRRAARALAATFAERIGGGATFLPRILPLGAVDALEPALLLGATEFADPIDVSLPAAIGNSERRMILTRLILAWSSSLAGAPLAVETDGRLASQDREALLVGTTPADAWHLSGELATLLDELATDNIAWDALKPLGTESFNRYWSITLDFLNVAVTQWPEVLVQRGRIDPAARRSRLIGAEIARLRAAPDRGGPVIVAGSTGTQQPTARLIAAVAHLPRGAVVLPGLDQYLDEAAWAVIGGTDTVETGAGHPQAALHRLLQVIGATRADVVQIGAVSTGGAARARLVSEALRPAETTDAWRAIATGALALDRGAALADVAVIEAADEREEALALAVALRETLESEGSAMLVTPDRTLARRVRGEMARWNIDIDDSGGEPLGHAPAGALARLVLDCVVGDCAPMQTLALLAHPAVRLGRVRTGIASLSQLAEIVLLRGVLPSRALHDVSALIAAARARAKADHASRALRALRDEEFTALEHLLAEAMKSLELMLSLVGKVPLTEWLAAHEHTIGVLIRTEAGASALAGADGTVLAELFDNLSTAADPAITLDRAGYAALFDRFMAEATARGPTRSHPRLKILGLLEARLLGAERVLLAGLDEGIWPPQVRTDAFLNRPMRAALGLAPPERRIAQTAHDFAMAFGAREVIVSRAVKRGGSPTVPSRLLQRMSAVAGEVWGECQGRGRAYLDFARSLDKPAKSVVIRPPAPKPPLHLRPDQLSVTRVELLRRDPYAIYAERILKLRPLDPVGAEYGPREWGTLFHGVLSAFTEKYRHGELPSGALDHLISHVQVEFAELLAEPNFSAFMGARLGGWARAFHRWEEKRRGDLAGIHVEAHGELAVPLDDGTVFILTAHADRIETLRTGAVRIIDYKTGATPSKKEVVVGFSPQLTLEAAMAVRGAFRDLGEGTTVESADYVKFGTGDAVDVTNLIWPDRHFTEVMTEHFEGLRDLLNSFRDPDSAYVSRPYPQFIARRSDYDHLSRVKEWSATGRVGEGEEGGG